MRTREVVRKTSEREGERGREKERKTSKSKGGVWRGMFEEEKAAEWRAEVKKANGIQTVFGIWFIL